MRPCGEPEYEWFTNLAILVYQNFRQEMESCGKISDMPYAILTTDKPDAGELRTQLRPAHITYLVERKHMLLAGGATLDDDGAATGSLLLVDTEDRAVAEGLLAGDPFSVGGLFEEARVVLWRKSFFDFERCA
jgi:uncharacterized protein YciI